MASGLTLLSPHWLTAPFNVETASPKASFKTVCLLYLANLTRCESHQCTHAKLDWLSRNVADCLKMTTCFLSLLLFREVGENSLEDVPHPIWRKGSTCALHLSPVFHRRPQRFLPHVGLVNWWRSLPASALQQGLEHFRCCRGEFAYRNGINLGRCEACVQRK